MSGEDSPGQPLLCPNCGTLNPADCLFCLSCGTTLDAAGAGPGIGRRERVAGHPAEVGRAEAVAAVQEIVQPPLEARRKKPRRWPFVVAGCAVLLIAGIVVIGIKPPTPGWLLLQYRLGKRDFSGVALPGADLSEAALFLVKLCGADLSGADLSGTILISADLSEAELSGADLHETNLNGADLSRANLREADLTGADLRGADLSKADLREADLNGANLNRASLQGAKLDDNTKIAAKWRLVWELTTQGGSNRNLAGSTWVRPICTGST